jgi:carbamoylphosphate synthase large subunit
VNGVLVTGIGGPAGRSVARQLVDRGFTVAGVDVAPPVCDVPVEPVPLAGDPAFVRVLTDIAARRGVALVIPTVSEELPVLARDRLGDIPLAVAGCDAVATADDKWRTYLRLRDAGVPVPCTCRADEVSTRVLGATGPWLSKPRRGRGGRGVVVHRRGGSTLPTSADLVVQEYVPGVEYAVNVYLAARPVAQVLEKVERAAGEIGNATSVRAVAAGDVVALAVRAVRALGLTGPADVDVRRRADGTPVVLEVNARFGAHSAHAPAVLDALLAEYGVTA